MLGYKGQLSQNNEGIIQQYNNQHHAIVCGKTEAKIPSKPLTFPLLIIVLVALTRAVRKELGDKVDTNRKEDVKSVLIYKWYEYVAIKELTTTRKLT